MNVLEREIEDIIYSCIEDNPDLLRERGLPLTCDFHARQMNLGDYGILDLVTAFKDIHNQIIVDIWELKKEKVDVNTLLQCLGYAKGLDLFLQESITNRPYKIRMNLIGKTIDKKSNFCYITDYLDVRIFTFSIDLEKGIYFHGQSGYSKINSHVPQVAVSYSELKTLLNDGI